MRNGLRDNETPDDIRKERYYLNIEILDRLYALAKRVDDHGGGHLCLDEKREFIMLLEWLQENVTEH